MRFVLVSIFLLAAMLMSSCQMQKLTIEAYSPPKIELPPDVRGILVTSRYVPAEGEYEAVQWGYFESVDSVKWELSRFYAESFSRILDSTSRYVSRSDFDLRMLRNNNDSLPVQLPWLGMLNMLEKYGAAGLAVLQGFDIKDGKTEIKKNDSIDSGFIATKKISITAAWRISQPERRRMLDENIYTFTKEFVAKGNTKEKAEEALPDLLEMKKQACAWAAKEYANFIIPGIVMINREYYPDGDVKLEEAHQAILEGNWAKAEAKWNYLAYQAEDDLVKAKASYNMALICEKDGRLNQALGFARKANNYLPHKRHLKLINDLTLKLFDEEEKRMNKEIIRNW